MLQSKYRWEGVIPRALCTTHCSRFWKGISNIWDEIWKGVIWNIGNGGNAIFWRDCWLLKCGTLADYCSALGGNVLLHVPVVKLTTNKG